MAVDADAFIVEVFQATAVKKSPFTLGDVRIELRTIIRDATRILVDYNMHPGATQLETRSRRGLALALMALPDLDLDLRVQTVLRRQEPAKLAEGSTSRRVTDDYIPPRRGGEGPQRLQEKPSWRKVNVPPRLIYPGRAAQVLTFQAVQAVEKPGSVKTVPKTDPTPYDPEKPIK